MSSKNKTKKVTIHDKVSELMLTKQSELPPKAHDYVIALSEQMGACKETYVTAFYDYCQIELGMRTTGQYKVDNIRRVMYKEYFRYKNRQIHKLKTEQPYFDDILSRRKSFDVRKNDRNFNVGDRLDLFEGTDPITPDTDVSKRKHCHVWVVYVLQGGNYGIKKGYCVLGITHNDPEDL